MDGTVFRIAPPKGEQADLPLRIGDEAVLIGKQGDLEITVDQVAEKAGTISYEILTGIGKRISSGLCESGAIRVLTSGRKDDKLKHRTYPPLRPYNNRRAS